MKISDIQRYDSKKMYEAYEKWPEISQESYFSKHLQKIQFKNIDHIVFAGVGGSGAIGDVISSILSKTNIHVNVVKGYLLPKTVGRNTLVVTTSVSGNSKEALSILQNARKSEGKFVAFSSGGKMKKFQMERVFGSVGKPQFKGKGFYVKGFWPFAPLGLDPEGFSFKGSRSPEKSFC